MQTDSERPRGHRETNSAVRFELRRDDVARIERKLAAKRGSQWLTISLRVNVYLITTQAKRNLSSRSGIGGVLSAT